MEQHRMLIPVYGKKEDLKKRGNEKDLLVLFPFHCDGFFRALFGAYTAAFAVFKVNFKIDTDRCVRAVQAAEAAFIAFFPVNHRAEGTPSAGLSGCTFAGTGDSQFCAHIFSSS